MTDFANPYPPDDWRHTMWAAWKEGLLQVNQGAGWWTYDASVAPTFSYGEHNYRRKP